MRHPEFAILRYSEKKRNREVAYATFRSAYTTVQPKKKRERRREISAAETVTMRRDTPGIGNDRRDRMPFADLVQLQHDSSVQNPEN